VTITNQLANTEKLNSNFNLKIKVRIFELHLTTLGEIY